MILIFDYFETLLNSTTLDFNLGLKEFWNGYYKDKCSFDEMKSYGEELFHLLMSKHRDGIEFSFIGEELPMFAERFGGEKITMSPAEEADFLMRCNNFELDSKVEELLRFCSQKNIPMYVLSNSGFSGGALMEILNRYGIGKYINKLWSSADYGRVKPDRGLFEYAVNNALVDNPDETKEDIFYIGDMYETDVMGASGVGIKSIWLNKKNGTDTEGLATHVVTSPEQIIGLLK